MGNEDSGLDPHPDDYYIPSLDEDPNDVDFASINEPTPGDIKSMRLEVGLSEAELANRSGLSEETIIGWRSGNSTPRRENLRKVLEVIRDEWPEN